MTLYHGTHRDNVQKILSEGLNESQHGNLGKGVYFVYGYEIAKAIAQKQNRAWGVIEARVDLFRRHGPWANVWENLLLMAGLMITAATLYKTRGNKSQTLKAFFTRIQTWGECSGMAYDIWGPGLSEVFLKRLCIASSTVKLVRPPLRKAASVTAEYSGSKWPGQVHDMDDVATNLMMQSKHVSTCLNMFRPGSLLL